MRCKHLILFLAIVAALAPVLKANAYHIPSGMTINIPDGYTVHFSPTEYVSTDGTDMHLQVLFEDGWVNYTVDSDGTQNVFTLGAQPVTVWIDAVNKTVNDGWTFGGGVTTVTAALHNASLDWNALPPFNYTPPVIPPYLIEPSNLTFYMQDDTQTTNGVLGYGLDLGQSAEPKTDYYTTSGNVTFSFGYRIWQVDCWNYTYELTGGTPEATVDSLTDGVGFLNSTLSLEDTPWTLGMDSFEVILYQSVNYGEWIPRVQFTTDRLSYKNLIASDWNFMLYVIRATTPSTTTTILVWGGNYTSLITNTNFEEGNMFDLMWYEWNSGNYLNFAMFPFYYELGQLVGNTQLGYALWWGIIYMIPMGSLYIRFRNLLPILLMFVLFGSAGAATLFVPIVGLFVVWLILLFAVAVLLFRVFR